MSEEKQYVTNFTFPNGETFYIKDEIIPDLDQASLGQVLTKTGENQLGWRTLSGGGGGGSGGAVDSVNGKTGAVMLDASDVGAYSKPSGGIPASDLASDVQTSLGKADTAVQPNAISGMATQTWVENKGYQTAPFEIQITQSGTTFSTTATAQEILDNADNCVAVLSGGNEVIKPDFIARNGSTAVSILFTMGIVAEGLGVSQVAVTAQNGNVTVQGSSTRFIPLPAVTSTDNGKFLRVVNGAWAAATVPAAESNSFGGGA